MSRYEFVKESVLNGYILDTENNRIVTLVSTKRPDLDFGSLEELIELANKKETNQHRQPEKILQDGWFCRNSPTDMCEYYNSALDEYNEDCCIYCGEPYERK